MRSCPWKHVCIAKEVISKENISFYLSDKTARIPIEHFFCTGSGCFILSKITDNWAFLMISGIKSYIQTRRHCHGVWTLDLERVQRCQTLLKIEFWTTVLWCRWGNRYGSNQTHQIRSVITSILYNMLNVFLEREEDIQYSYPESNKKGNLFFKINSCFLMKEYFP